MHRVHTRTTAQRHALQMCTQYSGKDWAALSNVLRGVLRPLHAHMYTRTQEKYKPKKTETVIGLLGLETLLYKSNLKGLSEMRQSSHKLHENAS